MFVIDILVISPWLFKDYSTSLVSVTHMNIHCSCRCCEARIAKKAHEGNVLLPQLPFSPPTNLFDKCLLTSFATNVPQNVTSEGTNKQNSACFDRSIVLYPTVKTVAPPVIAMVS